MEIPTLTDGVIRLDGFTAADIDAHLAGEDDEHARRFGWYPASSTRGSVEATIERWRDEWEREGPTRAFAVRAAADGRLVGGLELRVGEGRSVELSYWTFPTERAQGFAGRAVGLLVDHARTSLAVARIHAHIEADNLASIQLVERLGFTRAGTATEVTVAGEERRLQVYALDTL